VRIRHLWYHRAKRRRRRGNALLLPVVCDPPATIANLSSVPQPMVGWLSRWIAFLTTPFKFLGISGWTDTGCSGSGSGRLVRDAQHSTDGFWTIDVSLESFAIGGEGATEGSFLRLEIEPGTPAHEVCSRRPVRAEDNVGFGGPLVVDTDGPFLELHPLGDFAVIV